MGSAPAGAAPSALDLDAAPAGSTCPNCGASAGPGALFCEGCGYDFTTGQLPRSGPGTSPFGDSGVGMSGAAPAGDAVGAPAGDAVGEPAGAASGASAAGVDWVAEVWVDPDWHAAQEVTEPCPSPGMPVVIGLHGTSQLVGRRSVSRNIRPQIDCGADTGVSRRHAQLTTDGQRWWVEDLQSSNGTYVGTAGTPLPEDPVTPGQRSELPEDARIYVGAWTRIVVRAATDAERATG